MARRLGRTGRSGFLDLKIMAKGEVQCQDENGDLSSVAPSSFGIDVTCARAGSRWATWF